MQNAQMTLLFAADDTPVENLALTVPTAEGAIIALTPTQSGELLSVFVNRYEVYEYLDDDGRPSMRLRHQVSLPRMAATRNP